MRKHADWTELLMDNNNKGVPIGMFAHPDVATCPESEEKKNGFGTVMIASNHEEFQNNPTLNDIRLNLPEFTRRFN